jgi:hypothetical protein
VSSLPVFLDPALLAFVPSLTRQEFLARVNFLATWAQLVRTGDASVHVAPEVREYLARNDFFPAHDSIAAVLDSLDLRFRYAPEDIIGPINTILNRATLGLYCCIKDADHEEFTSSPPQPWHFTEQLNHQSQRAVLLARTEQCVHGVPTRLVLASLLDADVVTFSAMLRLLDPDEIPGFTSNDLPVLLNGELRSVRDFEGILDCRSSGETWEDAVDNVGIKAAIQLRCREKLKALGTYTTFRALPEFFVGSDFYASLLRNQASGGGRFSSVTLEACASAVLRLPSLEWNKFNKAHRKVDNAEPLRAHLTKHGTAMRLMAWERPSSSPGGRIEFSNIGGKWEEEISDTDPTDAI